MTNRQLQSLVTAVLILAVLFPVALSIWFAKNNASRTFNQELETYTARTQARIGMVIDQARETLQVLNELQSEPCSPEHLMSLRRLSYTHRYIQEIIWLDGLTPRCSSLESSSSQPPLPKPDAINAGGYRAWYTSRSDLGMNFQMVAIGLKRYVVIIDPLSFIDTVPFSSNPLHLALFGTLSNRVIASTSTLNPEVLEIAQREHLSKVTLDGNRYELQPMPQFNLMVVSWASLAPQEKAWRDQLAVWMPVSIFISLLAAAFISRLLTRMQTSRYRLANALKHRALTLHYQPVVELQSGRVVGAEALVRWQQSDGTQLSPDVFITLAEQTGMINELSRYVVDNVFAEMAEWLREHPTQHIAINLAAQDLTSTVLLDRLNELCDEYGVAHHQIAIELTERSFAQPEITGPILARYRQAGYPVCIDDFGTGYSSLSYLQELDVDVLKIDKSFIAALDRKRVTPHIIDMARSLELEMVAEGVEDADQEAWLHRHGVQYGQGWLYSKALPGPAFIAWAERNLGQNEDESLLES